ncbi:pentatricopeptide repeat-containing protein At4g37170-like [Selaginella moellendorffii]|uniref:pentatricopeptide repeat-containing protein At4g37170-like n=1 Tax=Selaginella moellendorffii TaxID=88036 RepID=UPI000D1C74A1|nr:pentatricopeptide repeat-containing protein At4g37170-like [Selaginella moellendorffii]|eukprot:XP_024531158.1 pentatricopeptide repeat-containing protein At4g37170-like [Selaginella moellendorffii]
MKKEHGYKPILADVLEEEKEEGMCFHSEKLAIAWAASETATGPITVTKNLRVCRNCHSATMAMSKIIGRKIVVKDAATTHTIVDGRCTCNVDFGKYKGKRLTDLLHVYLEWMSTEMYTHWGRHAKELLSRCPSNSHTMIDGKNIHSVETLKKMIRSRKDLEEANRIRECVRQSSYRNDKFVANLLIEMFGSCGSSDDARLVFDEIKQPNIYSWNIMLKVYTQNGRVEDAWILFEKMEAKSLVSWNIMLAAMAKKNQLVETKEFFNQVPEKDDYSWTILLGAYMDYGEVDEARRIFDGLKVANVVTLNTMVQGYA